MGTGRIKLRLKGAESEELIKSNLKGLGIQIKEHNNDFKKKTSFTKKEGFL